MKKTPHRKLLHGFSLVEIMVALVLLSMILLLLFSSLYSASKYWEISEAKIKKNEEIRLVTQFVRKYLSQAKPILWVENGEKQLLFRGEKDELFFTSSLPLHRGGGVHSLSLKLVKIDSKKQLVFSYSLLMPDTIPFTQENEESVTIANEVKSIDISYFGIEKINEPPRWYDSWENNHFLPQLVRIKINADNKNINWPSIEIPVKTTTYLRNQPEFIVLSTSP